MNWGEFFLNCEESKKGVRDHENENEGLRQKNRKKNNLLEKHQIKEIQEFQAKHNDS